MEGCMMLKLMSHCVVGFAILAMGIVLLASPARAVPTRNRDLAHVMAGDAKKLGTRTENVYDCHYCYECGGHYCRCTDDYLADTLDP